MTSARRVLGLSLSAALAAGGALAIGAPGAGASTWSPTATHALSLTNATKLGAASATTPLRLTIGLAPRNRAGLDALIRSQSTPGSAQYRKYLTPAQFTATYAASAATANTVRDYLVSQGLTHVTIAGNRLQITADATVAKAQQAFHTSIARFTQGGRTVFANTAGASVPSGLASSVTGVLGLSNLGVSAGPSVGLPKLTGYYPKEFNTVYHSWGTKAGDGTTLAVFAEGDLTQSIKDLRLAEAKQKLRQVPVSLVYAGIKSPDTAGADEWDLDMQTSTGVAPNAKKLYVYVATSLTDSDLARAINLFAAQNVAKSGSASLGECDALAYADGSTVVDDIAFAQAASQGQTYFASSGDNGSSCAVLPTNGVPGSGPTDTEYPASSPYAVSVGGTTLVTDDADTYQNEVSWNAGGGGASPVETGGYWQAGVVPTSTANLRGAPDVAFDADPNTGALIYVDGTPTQIGGTSLSSPLALGLWTRLQATHGNTLGFAPPKLYALYTKAQAGSPLPPTAVPGFHDITVGTNGVYFAAPGWDYTTGLGSWDVAALSKAIH